MTILAFSPHIIKESWKTPALTINFCQIIKSSVNIFITKSAIIFRIGQCATVIIANFFRAFKFKIID